MSERQALFAAILARPDDDTPRLAFADWLDEQDGPGAGDWAAVIRSQVEAARAGRLSPRWVDLAYAQADVFRRHRDDWVPVWPSRLGRLAFRRGFREAAEFEGRTFHALADHEFRATPIRAVKLAHLANRNGVVIDPEIPAHPALAGVHTLDLAGNRPQVARWLLDEAAPRMPGLRAVGLRGLGLDAARAAALVASVAAPGLEAVDLSRNPLFDLVGPELLFRHPAVSRLRWLDLQNTGVNARVLRELAASPHAAGLRVLDLSRDVDLVPPDPLGPDGVRGLIDGPPLPGLEALDLSHQGLSFLGGDDLAAWPGLASVRELRLAGNQLGYETAERLAASPHVRNLRWLDLTDNPIAEQGVTALLRSPNLAGLTLLTLGGTRVRPGHEVVRDLFDRFPGCLDPWPPALEPLP